MLRDRVIILTLLSAFSLLCNGSASLADDLGSIGSFSFTERNGGTITDRDLRGKVWIASFVFTRCTGGCPQVTATMKQLQNDLAAFPDIRLVTFTIDPDHDQPDELRKYAETYGANPRRWYFLTGKEDEIHRLMRETFHLHVQRVQGPEVTPGTSVDHAFKLALIDRYGRIQGYFDGLPDKRFPNPQAELVQELTKLKGQAILLLPPDLPAINALLNGLAALLIVVGFITIRLRYTRIHVMCMVTTLVVSAIFLTSYLYYHLVIQEGRPTRFEDRAPDASDWVRITYLAILLSHTILAIAVPPLALTSMYLGIRNKLTRHVAVARWTLPIWLYVSVTGVIVYVMLYRLYTPG